MKPHDAANRLEIAIPTLRQWAYEYREFLSPQAVGGGGRHRDFADHDLRVLFFVREQKRMGYPADEIHLTLRQLEQDSWEKLPDIPERSNMAAVPVVPEAAARAALDAERRSLLHEISFLHEQNKRLEEQLAASQDEVKSVLREKDDEVKELTRKLAQVETELTFYRSGRLKPE
jgi:DNA-binding transcriptional MerR regulator